ncbi:MAG TPA: hypothetical protein VK427_16630 [Kofleriaceae bacterium]|nr:hypothetical protein [Kofleriaceae bacterium]
MGALTDKVKGKLMKAEGQVTDDKVRETQGTAVETKGKVKGAIDRGVTKVKAAVSDVKTRGRAANGRANRKAGAARRTP